MSPEVVVAVRLWEASMELPREFSTSPVRDSVETL
jgi:hypothetical protein